MDGTGGLDATSKGGGEDYTGLFLEIGNNMSGHFSSFFFTKGCERCGELKEAIFFNYEGCRQWLAGCFPRVFKSAGENQSEKQGNWLDVAIGMAGDDPLKFNALKKENIYIVLKMLDNSLGQIEKLKEHNGANS